jgi:hypothetical protein
VEADDRGAWRDVVAAHGSGRAGYIANPSVDVHPDSNGRTS